MLLPDELTFAYQVAPGGFVSNPVIVRFL